MLLMTFNIGEEHYAVEAGRIIEVVPLVDLSSVPRTDTYVAGYMNYHGCSVPVIDLRMLCYDMPSRKHLSTRIILYDYAGNDTREQEIIGLIVEQATEIVKCSDRDFSAPPLDVSQAPWLGPMTTSSGGTIQLINVDKVLPDDLKEALFPGKRLATPA